MAGGLGGACRPSHLLPLSGSILIRFISNPEAPTWWGFLVAGLMFVCSVTQTLILHQYYHCIFVTALRLRTGIIGVIYRKVSGRQEGGWPRQLARGFGPSPSPPVHSPTGAGHHQFRET